MHGLVYPKPGKRKPNFNLQPCECNGHADTCDATTGDCHSCRDATHGPHCEACLNGYYGDPTLEVNIPCRECPCPNTKASGHSFADKCYLDRTNNEPVCECHEEYAGELSIGYHKP